MNGNERAGKKKWIDHANALACRDGAELEAPEEGKNDETERARHGRAVDRSPARKLLFGRVNRVESGCARRLRATRADGKFLSFGPHHPNGTRPSGRRSGHGNQVSERFDGFSSTAAKPTSCPLYS
jgi:hypothetical protein